jgi:hypothetical protein
VKQPPKLKEEIRAPDRDDGIMAVWLEEEGSDAKARKDMTAALKADDIAFRKLRRIVKQMFDKSVEKGYKERKVDEFELGYRTALQDLYKLIPVTRSE